VQTLGKLGAKEAVPALVGILKSEEGAVVVLAVEALGRMEAAEAAAGIEPLAGPASSGEMRGVAAAALCRLGKTGHVHTLLDWMEGRSEASPLNGLNVLRQKEAWSRLRGQLLEGERTAPRREILAQIAEGVGMKLEAAGSEDGRLRQPVLVGRPLGIATALDALEQSLEGTGKTFVLENDTIRVLGIAEALTFWRTWSRK
jgi:hypothetical protein